MAELDCMVATPDGPAFEGKARFVIVPGVDGQIGILARHAPLVAALGYGELRVEKIDGEKLRFFLEGGFVQVLGNRVTVLATEVESVADIEGADAQKRVEEVQADRPPHGAPLEEIDAYLDRVRAAKVRARIAG